jgi:hypothetical protein
MIQWFPPLEGVHVAGWIATVALGIVMVLEPSIISTGYGGFLIGFCVLWGWIRWRYDSIELRTAVEEVDA